tara:strand:- start:773 stop:2353 length:1581 start_codon:yes stop_codon:yes gene_type:complete
MTMNLYKRLFVVLAFVGIVSCDTLELDLQENPDALTLASADVDLVFNTIQFNFRNQMTSLGYLTDGPMRMVNFFGTYNPGQGTMNGNWSQIYNTGTNLDALKSFSDNEGFTFHYGVAQIMQATMYVNIVDYIGTAVFTEANKSGEFPNPGLDAGVDIYTAMYDLIDEGIANINGTGRAPLNDLYYGGDAAKWVAYANTLKLRMYLQTRLVNGTESTQGINALIGAGSLIDQPEEDLQFQYGTTPTPIESRHPLFTGNYINGAGAYMSNGLMSYMKDSMSVEDPRMKYYFYRQSDRTAADLISSDIVRCNGNANYDFCTIGDFYYGRDHTDNEGVPGDANIRTTYGIYPAMGAFDEGNLIPASQTSATGEGIAPLHLSSWTNFMLAESALTLGTTGSPATYLEAGMRQALQKVRGFSPANMTTGQIDDYVNEVLAEYTAASNTEKLDIITREWYISSYTNGLLPYNTYRRTGFPSFLQDPIINAGAFVRSYFLPDSELNSNSNPDFATQKSITDQVFWDTNPANFIN